MATGYLSAGHCWATANEAIDAYFSMQQQGITANSTATFRNEYTKVSGVWKLNVYTNATANTQQTLNTNVYGSCEYTAPQIYPTALTCTNCTGGTGGTNTTTPAAWDGNYDMALAMAAWSFAFVTTLSIWWLAKNIGIVMNAIRRW